MKLIIYMPAFNEAEDIAAVINGLPRQIDGFETVQQLVVDDGSTDGTAAVAMAAGARVVSHPRNRGVGAAFHSAVQFALENDADVMVGIDADGQFDGGDLPTLIEPIVAGRADMVIGNRFARGMPANMSPIRFWGNRQVARLIERIGGQAFEDVSCGYRAYGREALLRLNLFAQYTYTHETILALVIQGYQVEELPVRIKYSPDRKSRVAGSVVHYAFQTSKIMLRVLLDYRPMRVFGALGAVSIIIGGGFVAFLLGHFFLTGSFTPYKSAGIAGLAFVVFGAVVLLFALIADILNRLRLNQDRVLYELKKMRYEK